MTQTDPAAMIDLERYPVANIASGTGLEFANRCRTQYRDTGLCMLPGFVKSNALDRLVAEANTVADKAFFCDNTHNAYLTEADDTVSAESVEGRQEKTFVGSVAYDYIPENSHLRSLYLWDPLKDFIRHVLGKESFFRSEDPLGACSINVFVDGGEHGWHFDESEFTVTLMLQPPVRGGAFEYVPQIRGLDNERELVADILNGVRDNVVTLPFTPGTLLIFGGRQTIHRVTRVEGGKPRLVPVLCYSEKPGMINSETVRKLFWGRTGPEPGVAA